MKQKILAIAAHPDDIEFGCGAILIKEIKKGNDVAMLVSSLGEAGTHGTPAIRKRESQNAAKLIGASIGFLDFGGDCRIEHTKTNVFTLVKELRAYKPDIVLAPGLQENQHPDHLAVGKIARDAARLARFGGIKEFTDPPHRIANLYHYGVTQYVERPYDVVIDVTKEKDVWVKMIESHKSQMKTRRYVDLLLSRARFLGLSIGTEYAMGLFANDPIHLDTLSEVKLSSRNF